MKKNGKMLILLGLLFVFLLLTWIIPSGSFSEATYSSSGLSRAGIFDLFLMIYYSFYYKSADIMFLLIVGGFYGVLTHLDGYKKLVSRTSRLIKGHEILAMLVISAVMSIYASLTNQMIVLFALVPFIATVFLRRGCDKISAFNASMGGLLIGFLGQTFGTYGTYYLYNYTELAVSTSIVIKILMLVVTYGLYNLFAALHMNKTIGTVNETQDDMFALDKLTTKVMSAKRWPYVVFFVLTAIVSILAYIDWNTSFNVELFDNIVTGLENLTILDVAVLDNLLGNFNAFGSWDSLGLSFILLLLCLIFKFIGKMSFNDLVKNFGNGAKKMSRVAVIYVLAAALFVASYYFNIVPTIINVLIGSGKFNVFTVFIAAFLTAFLCVDLDYSSYILGNFAASAFSEKLVNATLVMKFGYAFAAVICPTSIILMIGLSYLDIPYYKWMAYIWKFALGILAIGLIGLCLICYV